jgi:hypothetical protein
MTQSLRRTWVPAIRGLVAVLFAVLVVLGGAVPSAFAWSNGGSAGDGFGTHDWILDQAIRLAGPDASWVDTTTALLATDDPDHDGERITHYFLERTGYRGAPQRVSDLYYAAVTAHGAGDRVEASRLLGLLSHHYADPLNPFHSAYAAFSKAAHHAPYEAAVRARTNRPGLNADWITEAARQPITDVRVKLIGAARFSRARFPRLIKALESTKAVDVTRSTVHAVTIEVMSRAANDLADIIGGIARHEGLSSPPAVMTLTLSKIFPAQHDEVTASARCTDASRSPMEGVGVTFAWPLPSGRTVSVVRYTGSDGIAHSVRDIGTLPWGVKVVVTATASASGAATHARASMAPRVALHSGPAGLRAKVSSAKPKRGSTVSVWAYVHSPAGHHLAGVAVLYTWKYRGRTVRGVRLTNSHGIARMRGNIGSAPRGRPVAVTVQVVCAGRPRRATASFVPR